MIEIGIVGCGTVVHENYAKALVGRPDYAVRWVHDRDQRQAASAAAIFGAEVVPFERIRDVAGAVIVTTPPSSHPELVRALLAPDRLILCEKPFMPTYWDAQAIVNEAKTIGARVYVGHFRRTFPQAELARVLVEVGAIGDVVSFVATEGGRFSWRAVSNYTTSDPVGGVLWDTGSHTLDTVMFVSGLDRFESASVAIRLVQRDQPEPSHDFCGEFLLSYEGRRIPGRLHVSRREALPGLTRIAGSIGELAFVAGLDDRVRLTTDRGSVVLRADRHYEDLMECFDEQVRRILLSEGDEVFAASRFLLQAKILEGLTDAA